MSAATRRGVALFCDGSPSSTSNCDTRPIAGRKLCFIGTSLNTYLEAAWRDGRAPFSPKDLIHWSELDDMDPSKVFIVTTGSQAEPRAALSLAAQGASSALKLDPDDLVLYSAKVGNRAMLCKGRSTCYANVLCSAKVGGRALPKCGAVLWSLGRSRCYAMFFAT